MFSCWLMLENCCRRCCWLYHFTLIVSWVVEVLYCDLSSLTMECHYRRRRSPAIKSDLDIRWGNRQRMCTEACRVRFRQRCDRYKENILRDAIWATRIKSSKCSGFYCSVQRSRAQILWTLILLPWSSSFNQGIEPCHEPVSQDTRSIEYGCYTDRASIYFRNYISHWLHRPLPLIIIFQSSWNYLVQLIFANNNRHCYNKKGE